MHRPKARLVMPWSQLWRESSIQDDSSLDRRCAAAALTTQLHDNPLEDTHHALRCKRSDNEMVCVHGMAPLSTWQDILQNVLSPVLASLKVPDRTGNSSITCR